MPLRSIRAFVVAEIAVQKPAHEVAPARAIEQRRAAEQDLGFSLESYDLAIRNACALRSIRAGAVSP
jgi:hypothetical protein